MAERDSTGGGQHVEDTQDNRERRIGRIVDELCFPLYWHLEPTGAPFRNMHLPSRQRVIDAIEVLRGVLFPGYFGFREFTNDTQRFHVGAAIDRELYVLQEEIRRALLYIEGRHLPRQYAAPGTERAITDAFLERLPEIRRKLLLDAQASYEWDPAVSIPEAPIFCYPNMMAMTNYRLAHDLYIQGVPFIPRIITEDAHFKTGIDIHPGAKIGESFFIDHGTGVVVGQTCEIGDRVRLFQGVTLGVKSFEMDEESGRPKKLVPRHPIIENDVTIYAEASVLGRITVGHHSVVGANVFLASSIPPFSKIFQPAARVGEVKRAARAQQEEINKRRQGSD